MRYVERKRRAVAKRTSGTFFLFVRPCLDAQYHWNSMNTLGWRLRGPHEIIPQLNRAPDPEKRALLAIRCNALASSCKVAPFFLYAGQWT